MWIYQRGIHFSTLLRRARYGEFYSQAPHSTEKLSGVVSCPIAALRGCAPHFCHTGPWSLSPVKAQAQVSGTCGQACFWGKGPQPLTDSQKCWSPTEGRTSILKILKKWHNLRRTHSSFIQPQIKYELFRVKWITQPHICVTDKGKIRSSFRIKGKKWMGNVQVTLILSNVVTGGGRAACMRQNTRDSVLPVHPHQAHEPSGTCQVLRIQSEKRQSSPLPRA